MRENLRSFLESSLLGLELAEPSTHAVELERLLCAALEGLDALDDGETPPLFSPARAKRRGSRPSEVTRLQLKAVAYVAVLRKMGISAEKAFSLIGDAYGRSGDAIKAWRKKLRKETLTRVRQAEWEMVAVYQTARTLFNKPSTIEGVLLRAKTDGQALKKLQSKKGH